ncbi:HSP20 family protein [Saonia flava]|uniref:HSP20 family protein n=1 Tax=Saonia flava TaxID=523696 RepID=A0A846R1Z9_9FLAO|nr:Hsp20/alpha crystallin family protein [Saonia flava]NJB72453.1 HSP20 family protein [Saonia flava]
MSLVKRNNVMLPSFVNDFLAPDWFGGLDKPLYNLPAVNIKENEANFELELAVPGRTKEDFKVEVDNDVLTISSETKSEDETTEENFTRREFSYTSFKRAFTLPESVESNKIDASYVNGVLTLSIPKKEEALPKPKRLIEIA